METLPLHLKNLFAKTSEANLKLYNEPRELVTIGGRSLQWSLVALAHSAAMKNFNHFQSVGGRLEDES